MVEMPGWVLAGGVRVFLLVCVGGGGGEQNASTSAAHGYMEITKFIQASHIYVKDLSPARRDAHDAQTVYEVGQVALPAIEGKVWNGVRPGRGGGQKSPSSEW